MTNESQKHVVSFGGREENNYLCKKIITMDIALNEYKVEVPTSDLNFFKKLVDKMGWVTKLVSSVESSTSQAKTKKDQLSPRLQWLAQHPIKLTEEDKNDDRAQYILSK